MQLANEFRPRSLKEFVGQKHLVSENGPIYKFLKLKKVPSMIFWGPPGTGKTSLAYIIKDNLNYEFFELSAVLDGKQKLKNILEKAKQFKKINKSTLLFIDEIHRWSKAQQDALLPFVESGLLTIIGATTENPFYSIIRPLISRVQVYRFYAFSDKDIKKRLIQIIDKKFDEKDFDFKIDDQVIDFIVSSASGDLRVAINMVEMIFFDFSLKRKNKVYTLSDIKDIFDKKFFYKKTSDHFDLISAVHKSLRQNQGIAASFYIVKMLSIGEDPLYIARRLIQFASEDIGNAKPLAIVLANNIYDTCKKVGMPECSLFLVQLALYLASCSKNRDTLKVKQFCEYLADLDPSVQVPLFLTNKNKKNVRYHCDHFFPKKIYDLLSTDKIDLDFVLNFKYKDKK